MPMLPGYEPIRETVKRAIERSGIVMRRLEVALTDAEWQFWLIATLPSASFAVVDVTDHNPFVMYELGLAHNRLLPSLLIVDARNERVPATVLGSPFLPYDGTAPHTCLEALARWIGATALACRAPAENGQARIDSGSSFETALHLLERFRPHSPTGVEAVSREEFTTRMLVAEGRGDVIPPAADAERLAIHLLPRLIRHTDDVAVMRAVQQWIGSGSLLPAVSPVPRW